MGVTRKGKLAALTNYRDSNTLASNAPSRGMCVAALSQNDQDSEYTRWLTQTADEYNGYSLLFGDLQRLCYFCNRSKAPQRIEPGLYGLSNRLLDTPWPKVREGKAALLRVVMQKEAIDPQTLFDILADESLPPAEQLPDTGVGPQWERIFSPRFISSQDYGTRSSTVLLYERSGRLRMIERTFIAIGRAGPLNPQQYHTRTFTFTV